MANINPQHITYETLEAYNKQIKEYIKKSIQNLNLSRVAVSGSYYDLLGTPDKMAPISHIHNIEDIDGLRASNDYNDLSNKPTKLSDFSNDRDYASTTEVREIINDVVSNNNAIFETNTVNYIEQHNTDTEAHNDIRNRIEELNDTYNEVQNQIDTAVSTVENAVTITNSNVIQSSNNADKAEQARQEADSLLTDIRNVSDIVDSTFTQINNTLVDTKNEVTKADNAVKSANTLLNTINSRVESVNNLVGQAESYKTQAQSSASTASDAVTHVDQVKASIETTASQVASNATTASTMASKAQKALTDMDTKVSESTTALNTLVDNAKDVLSDNIEELVNENKQYTANSLTNANTAKQQADRAKGYADTCETYKNQVASAVQVETDRAIAAETATNDALSQFRTDNAEQHENIEKQTSDLQRKVTNLRALLNGVAYTEEQDSTEAYAKTVPSGAAPWAAIESIGGKTLVLNQFTLIPDENRGTVSYRYSNISRSVRNADNSLYKPKSNHIYYCSAYLKCETDIDISSYEFQFGWTDSLNYTAIQKVFLSNTYKHFSFLWSTSNTFEKDIKSSNVFIRTGAVDPSGAVTMYMKDAQFIDLTLMFGAGNEPTTVEEVEAIIGTGYHPYNAGELVSGDVTDVNSVGTNLYDGSLEPTNLYCSGYTIGMASAGLGIAPIKLEPNTTYTISKMNTSRMIVGISEDAKVNSPGTIINNKVEKSLAVFTTTASKVWLTCLVWNKTDDADIPIEDVLRSVRVVRGNVDKPESRFGIINQLNIPDAIKSLPGYGWSAGTAKNYFYKEGNKTWYRQEVECIENYSTMFAGLITVDNGNKAAVLNNSSHAQNKNAICVKASYVRDYSVGTFYQNPLNWVFVGSSDDTMDSLKNRFSNDNLYYELAEPIITDITDLVPADWEYIEVEAGGTVEFKSSTDLRIPVPSTITYDISTKEAV